jgi:type IV secretory pathway VirB2 component (pilin)
VALAVQESLFEVDGGTPMVESARWMAGMMLGEIALGVCVIAVAFIGALMLSGRLPLREGGRVVVGCFVLLGAPVIASGFLAVDSLTASVSPPSISFSSQAPERPELPKANYNPYAQASVRDDR